MLPDSVTIFFIVTIFCTFSNLQILCFPYSLQQTNYTAFNPTKTQSQTNSPHFTVSYMFWPLHGHLQGGIQQRNTVVAHSLKYVQSKIQCFQLNC
jgi:hypothetical protein